MKPDCHPNRFNNRPCLHDMALWEMLRHRRNKVKYRSVNDGRFSDSTEKKAPSFAFFSSSPKILRMYLVSRCFIIYGRNVLCEVVSMKDIGKQQLGQRIRTLRKERGMRLKQVALAAGISVGFLGDIESGRTKPSITTLQKIARILGVSTDYLLGQPNAETAPDPSTPAWWYRDTPPTDVELEQFLKEANVWFYGRPLTDEDKEDLMDYLRWKWEKEKRRRERQARLTEKRPTERGPGS